MKRTDWIEIALFLSLIIAAVLLALLVASGCASAGKATLLDYTPASRQYAAELNASLKADLSEVIDYQLSAKTLELKQDNRKTVNEAWPMVMVFGIVMLLLGWIAYLGIGQRMRAENDRQLAELHSKLHE